MAIYKINKDGYRERPCWVSKEEYNSVPYGTEFSFELKDNYLSHTYDIKTSPAYQSQETNISSLKNIINRLHAIDDIYNYDNVVGGSYNALSFNTYHIGSGIRRGTVELNYYYSGSLIGHAKDKLQNGVLYNDSFGKIGFVLYREGFIVLTDSSELTSAVAPFANGTDNPRWCNFHLSSGGAVESVLEIDFINSIPTYTTTLSVDKFNINHSNNPTHIQSGSYSINSDNYTFRENDKINIKNVTQSPFAGVIANQEKETYITKIGLYDEERKLIGVASLANPLRKTENREFLFKLKIDI
jgi:hypothetical protein